MEPSIISSRILASLASGRHTKAASAATSTQKQRHRVLTCAYCLASDAAAESASGLGLAGSLSFRYVVKCVP